MVQGILGDLADRGDPEKEPKIITSSLLSVLHLNNLKSQYSTGKMTRRAKVLAFTQIKL